MPRHSGRHVLLAVLVCASAVFLLYSVQKARPRLVAATGARPESASAEEGTASVRPMPRAAPKDAEFARYEALASHNIFSERRSAPARPPREEKKNLVEPPPFQEPKEQKPQPRAAPNFAGWSYAGYVTVDDEELGLVKVGIVENESSESWERLSVGDSFLGATVVEITGEAVQLKSGASRYTLSSTEHFPLVPLEKGATSGPRRPRPR